MIRVLWFLALFAPLASLAQFTYVLDQSIPVQQLQGDVLSLPWAGGINAAQFNTMDLDGDGTDDLVLFDRMAGKVITFVGRDNTYVAAPEYENLFPEINNWLLLRDYNCDGKKDIFTGDALGIKVYRNIAVEGGSPEWEHHLFSTGFPGPKSTVLLTQGSENKVNLQLQFDDLPAIGDVDGDGDIDILNIQYTGHTVEFHQNLRVENNLPCDSLEFKRVTRTWGDFRECKCGQFAFNGGDCPPNSGGRTQHAGGKSLLALDVNGDQQQDLLFSEAGCTMLYSLTNEGTTLNPDINTSSPFPAANPVNFVIFPAAFYEDVDFDGKKDLIATPNVFTREYLNANFRQSTWFYKNTGTSAQPVFSLVGENFLQGDMLDVGDNAVPAFFDFDADGDFDMFISNHSGQTYASTVYLYENTGSQSSPSFSLINEDYFGFSASRFYNVKIQFADIDSDQTTDLVFTATNFDDYLTKLYYLRNKSTTVLDFSSVELRTVDFHLTNTENVYITDVNNDDLADILAGRSEGNLEYWKNNGIEGAPLFVREEENFLGLNSTPLRQNLTCATADLDDDGSTDLLLGDQTGILQVIPDFQNTDPNALQPVTDIVFNPLLETYSHKNLGGKVWPVVVNLFNATKPAIAVGNGLGGLHLLQHDDGKSLAEEPELNIYPNPIAKHDVLNVQADRPGSLQVISVLGQQLSSPITVQANQIHRYVLPSLASGLYLLKFTSANRSHTRRLVIR
ncbi:MAG: T9SS type A sorting domain-containing protein [Cyclobacteriaceae bacterium]